MALFIVDSKEIKSIHIGENTISLCQYEEKSEEKFINFHKYSKVIDKSKRIKFNEIIKITVINKVMSFKSYSKFEDLNTKLNNIRFSSQNDANIFLETLTNIELFNITTKKENKFIGVLKSNSFLIFLFGAFFSYLLISGNTHFDINSGSTKTKLGALLLNSIINFLGLTLATIICVLIFLLGSFLIWKKFNNPFDIKTVKPVNSKTINIVKTEDIDEIIKEIKIADFGGTNPELTLRKNKNAYLIVEMPPFIDGEGNEIKGDEDFPEIGKFENLISEYIGQKVLREDREVFIIPNATDKSLDNIKYFMENYWVLRKKKYK